MTMCIKDMNGAGDSGSESGLRRVGRCKWFNVAKGWGFITPVDGGADVFVHQSVIQMSGFRSLGDEELVEFECRSSDKGLEATTVTGPEGEDCKGSNRRPMSRKKFRKIRCYNCGEFANHIAAKCSLGPQPKRCHHCKSEEHLIADCPHKEEKKKTTASTTSMKQIKNNGNVVVVDLVPPSSNGGHEIDDDDDDAMSQGIRKTSDFNGHVIATESPLSPSSSSCGTSSSLGKGEL